MLGDQRECIVPRDGDIAIRSRVVCHWVRQTARHLQIVVAPPFKLGDAVSREELRRAPLASRFPGDRLRAIFAELE